MSTEFQLGCLQGVDIPLLGMEGGWLMGSYLKKKKQGVDIINKKCTNTQDSNSWPWHYVFILDISQQFGIPQVTGVQQVLQS